PQDLARVSPALRLVHQGAAGRLRAAPATLRHRIDGGSGEDLRRISRATRDDRRVNLERLPFATIDHLRPITQGHQEVIFAPGKTVGQVVAIAERLEAAGSFLATRAD